MAGKVSDRDLYASSVPKSVLDRFRARVRITPTCHLFEPACIDQYGAFFVGAGVSMRAHRFALLHEKGPPPRVGMSACHRCPNKNCVNPAHLNWGSVKQNAADRKRDGTEIHPMGKDHVHAKLTDELARRIVEMYAVDGLSVGAIAAQFSVTEPTIRNVVIGVTWRAATEGLRVPLRELADRPIKKGSDHHMAKIDLESVPTIRARWAAGESSHKLGKEYGVAPRTIRDIGNRVTWKQMP